MCDELKGVYPDSSKNPQHAKMKFQSYAMGLRFEDLNK